MTLFEVEGTVRAFGVRKLQIIDLPANVSDLGVTDAVMRNHNLGLGQV